MGHLSFECHKYHSRISEHNQLTRRWNKKWDEKDDCAEYPQVINIKLGEEEMTRRLFLAATLAVIVVGLNACAAYRDFYTTASNGFQKIAIEVSPELQKVATIENARIDRKQGAGQSFNVTGEIQYSQSCRILSINVSFINTAGVALHNTKAPIMNYAANTKARFMASAYIVAMVGETKDILDKVVLGSLECL